MPIQVDRSAVKILIILIAMLSATMGALHAYDKRSQYIQAALLSEAHLLTAPLKRQIADHYIQHGTMPHDNADLGLPRPDSIFGTSVKRVAITRGGVMLVDFEELVGERSVTFTPDASPITGQVTWRCSSDSIEPEILGKLRPGCSYLPATSESQLMHAIANQDLGSVSELLAAGARPDAVVNGNTPLMLASGFESVEIVAALLDAGASINNSAIQAERRTPLMVAISRDRESVAAVLLARGASVTQEDYKGRSALDHAALTDERLGGERYTLMLSARFNPRFAARPESRRNPTESASDRAQRLAGTYVQMRQMAQACRTHRLEDLLAVDGEPSQTLSLNGQPLVAFRHDSDCSERLLSFLAEHETYREATAHRAAALVRQCDADAMARLMEINPELDVMSGTRPLLNAAITQGCSGIVSTMIRDRKLRGRLPPSLLLLAIRTAPERASVSLVGQLIAAGADVDGRGSDGQTALDAAIMFDQPVVAKYLMDAGADVDLKTINGSTVLIEATKQGREHLVQQLLTSGAAVNAQDSLGRTALVAAVAANRPRIVNLLLRAGADPGVRDHNGIDAVTLAESTESISISEILSASLD